VDLLDATLRVLPVPAHVPLADRAGGTGDRVRAADDADDEVALLERARRARVEDPAQRLVAEDEAVVPGRRPAVLPLGDLDVRPADADGDGFDEDRALADLRLGDLFEAGGAGLHRFDGDGLHAVCPSWRNAAAACRFVG